MLRNSYGLVTNGPMVLICYGFVFAVVAVFFCLFVCLTFAVRRDSLVLVPKRGCCVCAFAVCVPRSVRG